MTISSKLPGLPLDRWQTRYYFMEVMRFAKHSFSDYVRHRFHLLAPVQPVLKFPFPVFALNGADKLSPNAILVADSVAGLIWRVDLSADGMKGIARVWLKDKSMKPTLFSLLKKQPGINGLAYCRIDPHAGIAYITTHRENTIECVPLDPDSSQVCYLVAGIPFDERLIGPSAFAWGRGPEGNGSIAYVTTDGGLTAPPPDGVVRSANVLRIELPHAEEATLVSIKP